MEGMTSLEALKILLNFVTIGLSVYALISTRALDAKFKAQGRDIENKRLFLPVWDKLVQVNAINPQNPVAVDVRIAINTLELVALLWEAGIVDRDMVVLAFGNVYKQRHNELNQIHDPVPGLGQTGPQLFASHPVIAKVLTEIQQGQDKRAGIASVK